MKRPGTVTHVCAHSGEGADGSSPPPEVQTNEQLCLQSEWVTPEVDLWPQAHAHKHKGTNRNANLHTG